METQLDVIELSYKLLKLNAKKCKLHENFRYSSQSIFFHPRLLLGSSMELNKNALETH